MITELVRLNNTDLPHLLDDPSKWDSLIVNKRKPFTYRVFTSWGDQRICLHKFDPCFDDESFMHPHPWQGAFMLLEGSYRMTIGTAKDRFTKPDHFEEMVLVAGSCYSIMNPLTFHTVTPLTTCYTIMLNSAPFPADVAHTMTVTTKGKDLDKMSANELQAHLNKFKRLIYDLSGR